MKTSSRKATFLASLGAALEYYDFIIYGMMAAILSRLFFPPDANFLSNMKAFGVFAVGYIARPIGGLLFGHFADLYGRKRSFLTVMYMMALSTFCIGLLPTYAQGGEVGALFLVGLRVLQGISFGAELPGAITVICEYADKKSQGTHSGFLLSSVTLGSLLASFILFLVTGYIDESSLNSWGWRVPFLLGGTLALVNGVIRSQLDETPEFARKSKTIVPRMPVAELLKESCPQVVMGIGMTSMLASLVIFVIFLPAYLKDYFGYDSSTTYLSITYGMVWSAISLPLCGLIADRVEKKFLFMMAAVSFVLVSQGFTAILAERSIGSLVMVLCIIQTFISLLTVCYFPIISQMFSVEVRYTGIALCYNIA